MVCIVGNLSKDRSHQADCVSSPCCRHPQVRNNIPTIYLSIPPHLFRQAPCRTSENKIMASVNLYIQMKHHKNTLKNQQKTENKAIVLCAQKRESWFGPQKQACKTVLVASRALIAHTQNTTCGTENAADSPQVRQAG